MLVIIRHHSKWKMVCLYSKTHKLNIFNRMKTQFPSLVIVIYFPGFPGACGLTGISCHTGLSTQVWQLKLSGNTTVKTNLSLSCSCLLIRVIILNNSHNWGDELDVRRLIILSKNLLVLNASVACLCFDWGAVLKCIYAVCCFSAGPPWALCRHVARWQAENQHRHHFPSHALCL